MRMKISLALGPRQSISRQTAWGCFTTNLALPGFGSLTAGRRVGYAQAVLGLGGLILTIIFGARFMGWYFANSSSLTSGQNDPLETLHALWLAVRGPLVSLGVFAAGWLWALITSFQILASAKPTEPPPAPPRLD